MNKMKTNPFELISLKIPKKQFWGFVVSKCQSIKRGSFILRVSFWQKESMYVYHHVKGIGIQECNFFPSELLE